MLPLWLNYACFCQCQIYAAKTNKKKKWPMKKLLKSSLFSLFTITFIRFSTHTHIYFFFLGKNRMVPKDQIKTSVSQQHSPGNVIIMDFIIFFNHLDFPALPFLVKEDVPQGWLQNRSCFLAEIKPFHPLPNSGKLYISEIKTKVELLNCLLWLD